MKINKSHLRQMIRESVKKESVSLARQQKKAAHYALVCLHNTPFINEYRNIRTKKQLKEFFGPLKKLGVQDLEKMGLDKENRKKASDKARLVKAILGQAKEVEKARRAVARTNLNDVTAVTSALDNYVNELIDLYLAQKGVELSPQEKAAATKPFALAAYTLQGLSKALNKSANNLFSAVPKSSNVYSAGREAQDIEQAKKKFMRGPGQQIASVVSDLWNTTSRGMSVGRHRPR